MLRRVHRARWWPGNDETFHLWGALSSCEGDRTMDHNEAVRQNASERYLLDELDPELRDQFEEHLFDCQDCALDVRAGAMFVEQTKIILSEPAIPHAAKEPVRAK